MMLQKENPAKQPPSGVPGAPATRPGRADLLACLLLILVTWLIYGQALAHEFLTNWDDSRYILQNEAIRGVTPGHLKQIFTSFYVGNYAPLHLLSYMLDYSLWGLDPRGFVAGNILLHGGNCLLLYALFRTLTLGPLPALFGALVFAVHPVQVESVAWISQRKNLLALFFSLGTLFLYVQGERGGRSSRLCRGLALLAFVLALLAKSVAVTLPLALVAYDRTRGGRSFGKALRGKLPYLAAALLVGALAIVSQSPQEGGGRVPYHGGSIWTTALTMVPVLVRYVRLVVWPSALSALYDPPVKSGMDGEVLLALALLALLAFAARQLVRRRPEDGFWLALIVTGLLPVCQIVPIITLMNDRYLYFPMIGIAGLCASLAATTLAGVSRRNVSPAVITWCAVIALLAGVAWYRVPVWQNSLALWNDAVVKAPGSSLAWYGLGEAYHTDGRLPEAKAAYLRALALKPSNGEVINNLGVLALDMGEPEAARRFLLPLLQQDPRNIPALLNFAGSYVMEGNYGEAGGYYARAHELSPADPKPLAGLGGVCLLAGDAARSRDYFARAEQAGLGPDALAFYKAGIMSAAGHRSEALAYLEEAVRLGYRDFAPMAWDRNFDPIRGSAAYRRLIPETPRR
jgi:Flp pilus assembly protein TadD